MAEEEEPKWFRVVGPRKSNTSDISTIKLNSLASHVSRNLLNAERLDRAEICYRSRDLTGLFFGKSNGVLANKLRENRAEIIPLERQDKVAVINNGAGSDVNAQLQSEYDLALGIIKKFMETEGFELTGEFSDEEADIIGSAMERE
jgi:hypothetical protein